MFGLIITIPLLADISWYESNNILQKQILKQKKLSADWDSNPDPSVSGRVPLPLELLICFWILGMPTTMKKYILLKGQWLVA